ncbi:hypothetical protein K2173_006962 [Erythroxylum novogranatense]|uniref:Uncharacterized protein n=1 Tax=Erythroxylum novogranatense TaxID=1862640 RepID=A0AAV8SY70_9ROSI|nr:hypothetical protein K2173_006962 [Erythroxylum novogranatense]
MKKGMGPGPSLKPLLADIFVEVLSATPILLKGFELVIGNVKSKGWSVHKGNGTAGESIYGLKFAEEYFMNGSAVNGKCRTKN